MLQLTKRCFPVAALCGLMLSACTSEPVKPSIKTFADAVGAASAAGQKSFDAGKLDTRAETLRQKFLAGQGGVLFKDLGDSGTCAPGFVPSGEIADPLSFDEICGISAFVPDPSGEPRKVAYNLPSIGKLGPGATFSPDQKTVLEFNASRALAALSDYSSALSALATSEAPGDVGAAAAQAIGALSDTADAAAKISGDPVPADVKAVIATGGTLIADLTREALEARRYQLLSKIVRGANPVVAELSRAASGWFYVAQESELLLAYKTLNDAVSAAVPGDQAGIAAVAQARDKARKLEHAAQWRLFWEVALAHNAILESLDAPADFDRLLAANARIQKLVKSTKAFVEAVETVKE